MPHENSKSSSKGSKYSTKAKVRSKHHQEEPEVSSTDNSSESDDDSASESSSTDVESVEVGPPSPEPTRQSRKTNREAVVPHKSQRSTERNRLRHDASAPSTSSTRTIKSALKPTNRSTSRPVESHLILTILKVKGLDSVPNRFSANCFTIEVTYEGTYGKTFKTSQMERNSNLCEYAEMVTFKWKLDAEERKFLMRYPRKAKVHLELRVERDEDEYERKWTHLVGTADLKRSNATEAKRGLQVELVRKVKRDGVQKIEYKIEVQVGHEVINLFRADLA